MQDLGEEKTNESQPLQTVLLTSGGVLTTGTKPIRVTSAQPGQWDHWQKYSGGKCPTHLVCTCIEWTCSSEKKL